MLVQKASGKLKERVMYRGQPAVLPPCPVLCCNRGSGRPIINKGGHAYEEEALRKD